MSGPLDFGCRPSLDDHLPNVIRKIEQFLYRSPAAIARAIAFQTTFTLIEGEIQILIGLQA